MAICVWAAASAEAQADSAGVREKAVTAHSRKPGETRPAQVRRDTASAGKSVSERLFDAGWVIFPARLALVIVFVTIALLLLMLGTWSTVRVAHSLRHTKWAQPPRRLKRGELGAAGTSVALEFEERLHDTLEQNAARDRQLALLHETVARLSQELDEVVAAVTTLFQKRQQEDGNGPEVQG